MVIFSHILSRTSRPDSGQAIALATVAMSVWMERWKSSNPEEEEEEREIRGRAEMLPNRSTTVSNAREPASRTRKSKLT